jgi:hypothetical protein
MRYQTINPDNRIVNSTRFGRRLRRFLRKPEQRALLRQGCSWRADGSWILADALVHWSGGRLGMSCLRAPDGKVGHVVATEPAARAFIDADGIAGQIDLMTKMAVIMHAPNVTLDRFEPEDAARAGLPYEENVAIELAVRLLHRFGSYRPELLTLTEQATTHSVSRPRSDAINAGRAGFHRPSYSSAQAFA